MRIKWLCFVLTLVLLAATATSASAEGVTLKLYGDAGNLERPYMQRIFELYEEKSGNKLDLQGIESDNFETVCLMKFQTGDLPDLFLHQGGYSLDAYNPEQNFYDFSDAAWVSDVQPSVLPSAMRNGKVYGIPYWEASYSGLLYNKTLLGELGLSVPKTQAEFDQLCADLLQKGVTPIFLAAKESWPLLYQYGMDPIFQDQQLLDKLNTNQTTYADIPQMRSMLEWFQSSAQKGYFGKTFATDTWDYIMEVLGEGEAAMVLCWDTWLYSDYDNESYKYKVDDFGLMPAFMNTTDDGTFEGPNVNLTIANKNSQNLEAALGFVEFMADPENYNQGFDGFQTAPVFKGQTTNVATPQYEEAADWIGAVGRASIANPNIVGFSLIDGGKCIQELMIGNIDVDQCLKLMDEERVKSAVAQQAPGFAN